MLTKMDPIAAGHRITMFQVLGGMFFAGFGVMVMVAWSVAVGLLCWGFAFTCFQAAFMVYFFSVQAAQIQQGRQRNIIKPFR